MTAARKNRVVYIALSEKIFKGEGATLDEC